jgi:hypothetical protein
MTDLPLVIIAGIRQFGLASDGADLRDLGAWCVRARDSVRELEARTHADIVRLTNDVSSLLVGRDFDMGEKRTLEARNAALTKLLRTARHVARVVQSKEQPRDALMGNADLCLALEARIDALLAEGGSGT